MKSWRRSAVVAAAGAALLIGAGPAAAVGATAGNAACPLPVFGPGSAYHPHIDPAQFSARVDNPLFPLKPGITMVYTGTEGGQKAVDLFHPTTRTVDIDGVRARVVEDRLFLDGRLAERTSDYYAEDRCGNVWYFGEDTAELDRQGHVVSTEGSFHAGVGGAEPGVFMQAAPQLGRTFRQEWLPGQAEDLFRAVERSASVTVPYGSFDSALRTEEWTPLEPGVLDNKWYVRGIGTVKELTVKGPLEKLVLVAIRS